jgi:hypothetical protein
MPVSVEAIKGFLELAKGELKIEQSECLTTILTTLAQQVHPLVLGEVYRAKTQIQMLARKLITTQIQDEKKIETIISFLCSESGSHDYSIHRREAKNILGLNIEKPTDPLYELIKKIYDDIVTELNLTQIFDPNSILGGQNQAKYSLKRALIESVDGGSYFFVSEGILMRRQVQVQPGIQQIAIQDQRDFEGWRHENV